VDDCDVIVLGEVWHVGAKRFATQVPGSCSKNGVLSQLGLRLTIVKHAGDDPPCLAIWSQLPSSFATPSRWPPSVSLPPRKTLTVPL
jgi:hypothetical protein